MDVVGGVIVAADHKDDRAYRSRRGVKRGRCCGDDGKGSSAATAAAMVAWADEPWSSQRGRVKKTGEEVDLHEDYELRSVLSLYRPTPVLSLQQQRQPAKPVVVVPPARSWADPLRFLLKKELTVTDVGDLGRIILPKRDAECQLPHLDSKEGKLLKMEDYNSNKNWTLRYKWWPNNKSRMYVLESTGEFVKYYELKEKDELIVYMDGWGNLVIRGRKWSSPPLKTDSFLGSSLGFKGLTPTGKRSPKGRSNLSRTSTSTLNSNTSSALTTTAATPTVANTSALSTLTTSGLSTTSVFTTSSYGVNVEPVSNEIVSMGALVGPSIVGPSIIGPFAAEGSPIMDWEKLPEPPAIEFSDPLAIEFPGEFECTWADCI